MTYHPSKRLRWLPTRRSTLQTLATWLAIGLISLAILKFVTRPKAHAAPIPWRQQLSAAWA